MTDWISLNQRIARSIQTLVGWIFWDPGAIEKYKSAGLPAQFAGPLGYVSSRCAPLADSGSKAVVAAFGSISPLVIETAFNLLDGNGFRDIWELRNEAILEGLTKYAPELNLTLSEFGPRLWSIVEQLPLLGRIFFASHLKMTRSEHPVLFGWHAANCLREWRGDTHWAIIASMGLTAVEASILHNEWLGYEDDWLSFSRGITKDKIDEGWRNLKEQGLADNRIINQAGINLRQNIEDSTNLLTILPWQLLGEADTIELINLLEPPCEKLLKRVDVTAGEKYQPASRIR